MRDKNKRQENHALINPHLPVGDQCGGIKACIPKKKKLAGQHFLF